MFKWTKMTLQQLPLTTEELEKSMVCILCVYNRLNPGLHLNREDSLLGKWVNRSGGDR